MCTIFFYPFKISSNTKKVIMHHWNFLFGKKESSPTHRGRPGGNGCTEGCISGGDLPPEILTQRRGTTTLAAALRPNRRINIYRKIAVIASGKRGKHRPIKTTTKPDGISGAKVYKTINLCTNIAQVGMPCLYF